MKKLLMILLAITCISCASKAAKHTTVVPRVGGIYDVVSKANSKEQATKWALEISAETCKDQGARYVVISDQSAYNGIVSEDTNKAIDVASDAAMIFAGAWVPNILSGQDYQVGLRIRCEESTASKK